MSESQHERSYSVLDNMQKKLGSIADQRIRALSKEDLKGVMVYLENQQLQFAQMAATEDDPLQGAKMRGRVEMLVDLNAALFSIVDEKVKADQVESKEDENV